MRKVWDIYPFFNESMIADIRFSEIKADYTVVIEGNRTFSGIPKNFTYPFPEKVRHIKVTRWPDTSDPWKIEEYQENQAKRATGEMRDDDIVICADADEIPKWETIEMLKKNLSFSMPAVRLKMTHHKFFFNRVQNGMDWPHAGVCTGAMFKQRNFTGIRRWNESPVIEKGGWHLYGMGSDQDLKRKFQSTSHFNEPSSVELIDKLDKGWSLIQNEVVGLADYDIHNLPKGCLKYPQFIA